MPDHTREDIERKIAKALEEKSDTLILSHIRKDVTLPKSILKIKNLRYLSIGYSYNVDIPNWLADIRTLETLDLEEGGDVSAFIPHIGKLEQLRELRIFYMDGFSELPSTVENLCNLKEFTIGGAYFEIFPKELVLLKNLESFSYTQCDLDLHDVFNTLSQIHNLKKLYFDHYSEDGHESLPDSFVNLQSLEEIHFENWQHLDCLPEDIDKMQSLRVIDVSNSDGPITGYDANIVSLPEAIGNLKNLETLDIYGCQNITRLPSSFRHLSSLKHIDIIHSGITDLCLTDEQWTGLESLRMQGTWPDVTLCANLKTFAWYSSGVSHIFTGEVRGIEQTIDLPIACLHNLENLQIYGGTVNSLDFMDEMPKLRRITLNCNFSHLPDSLGKMKNLEYLSIFGAISLNALPQSIADLQSLEELHISASGIKSVPYFLTHRKDMHIDIRKTV